MSKEFSFGGRKHLVEPKRSRRLRSQEERRKIRREQAEDRQALRAKLTPAEQLAKLGSLVAKKERARLQLLLNKQS